MHIVQVTDWSEFIERTDAQPGWAFRGEVSAHWPLVSSLTRRLQSFCPDPLLWPLRESRALRVFRRKAHIYVQDANVLANTLRCLALMQHHGAPTRLLDFTKSPYVAAFFALEEATEDAAVYALNTPVLWSARPQFNHGLTRDLIDPRDPGNFEKYFLNNELPILWFGEPTEMDRRLVAQSGLFVIPGVLDRPIDAILQEYEAATDAPLIVKYVLPRSLRTKAMDALYRMNVTQGSLFPDLEGLARSTAYELEVVWERLVDEFQGKTSG